MPAGEAVTFYFEVPVDGAEPVRIELNPSEVGVVPVGRDGAPAARAVESLQQAIDRIRPVAATLVERLRQIPTAPNTVSAEFGIKFSVEAGALIARTSGEAHVNVTLTWDNASSAPE
jgi:hypothetical protein